MCVCVCVCEIIINETSLYGEVCGRVFLQSSQKLPVPFLPHQVSCHTSALQFEPGSWPGESVNYNYIMTHQ